MLRTRLEREEELQALRCMTDEVPVEDDAGEDNDGAIRAQINVIDTVLTSEQVYELYDDCDEFVLNAAVAALSWLRDDDESPADRWKEQLQLQIAV